MTWAKLRASQTPSLKSYANIWTKVSEHFLSSDMVLQMSADASACPNSRKPKQTWEMFAGDIRLSNQKAPHIPLSSLFGWRTAAADGRKVISMQEFDRRLLACLIWLANVVGGCH